MSREAATPAVTLRPMARADAAWSADLHRRALDVGLFPSLGPRFLRRYHRTFVESPFAVALMADVDDVPAGFVLGILQPGPHRRETLRTHGTWLAVIGLCTILVRPALLFRFARTRLRAYVRALWRHLRPNEVHERHDSTGGAAVLCHIAVEDSQRGLGLGKELVDALVGTAGAAGRRTVTTSTVDAASFYESLGWTHITAGRTFDGEIQHRLTTTCAGYLDDRLRLQR
ncbi:MAG: GNAT family N-acetyltransferase [Acidimicrobiia bacterium]